MLEKVSEERQYIATFVAGAVAGVAASFIRVPTEVIK